VESEFAQLIALFAAWRDDIDAEPFAHEADWAAMNLPTPPPDVPEPRSGAEPPPFL
jgi:hypothetical protein